jgi:triosephosphate isomerase
VRKFLIAGNWKMHGSLSQVTALTGSILRGLKAYPDIDILVCPAFPYLTQVHQLIARTSLWLGAQNLYPAREGAFTGEVSGPMLKDVGCQYALVGHSERRGLFHEDFSLVAEKFKAASEAGLTPILCVGETQKERERGETEKVIAAQINSVLQFVDINAFQHAVIAYEPVWAIGTGLTATPEQAQAVHARIRHQLAQNNVDIAETIRILYGGSMKAENATQLLAMPDIDGGLIGGASLDANSFLAICAIARRVLTSRK